MLIVVLRFLVVVKGDVIGRGIYLKRVSDDFIEVHVVVVVQGLVGVLKLRS